MPLRYLLHLEHANLPMHVTDAQDVRRVSVLKATGLIEAAIDPAFDTDHGSYRLAQAALVVCITEEGHAEIEKLRGHRGGTDPASRRKKAKTRLEPLDYLRAIERSAFPLRVEDPQEISCVGVPRARLEGRWRIAAGARRDPAHHTVRTGATRAWRRQVVSRHPEDRERAGMRRALRFAYIRACPGPLVYTRRAHRSGCLFKRQRGGKPRQFSLRLPASTHNSQSCPQKNLTSH